MAGSVCSVTLSLGAPHIKVYAWHVAKNLFQLEQVDQMVRRTMIGTTENIINNVLKQCFANSLAQRFQHASSEVICFDRFFSRRNV